MEYISVDGVNKMNKTRSKNYSDFVDFLLYKKEKEERDNDTVESLIDDYKKYIKSQEESSKQ